MYTEAELKAAADIIRQLAREHHVPEEQVRAEVEEAMQAGRDDPDPAVQARWAAFHYAGERPTVEEFILWTADMVLRTEQAFLIARAATDTNAPLTFLAF